MLDTPQHQLLLKELDPHLLITPYRIQTNWHVITGAPSCGKTTLIDQLAAIGYQTVAESSRQYIEQEIAKGRTFQEIYSNKEDARGIRNLQLRTEQDLQASDRLFIDRALPDCFAFFRTIDMDPNNFLAECFHHRYASVFILDRLPLELDGVRLNDDPLADYVDQWLDRDYRAMGYDVIRVLVLPPPERLAFILDNLSYRDTLR